MTNTCGIYNSLTSFTGICLVKADNCVASKQASKQALDSKQIKETREARAWCRKTWRTGFLRFLLKN